MSVDTKQLRKIYSPMRNALMASTIVVLCNEIDETRARIAELELRLDAYNGNLLDVLLAENERLREEVERLSRQTGDK